MVVARWVRPAIEPARDVPLVGEVRMGYTLWSLCAESFLCSTFSYIFITCFSLFVLLCLFVKSRIVCFGFVFRIFSVLFGFKKS